MSTTGDRVRRLTAQGQALPCKEVVYYLVHDQLNRTMTVRIPGHPEEREIKLCYRAPGGNSSGLTIDEAKRVAKDWVFAKIGSVRTKQKEAIRILDECLGMPGVHERARQRLASLRVMITDQEVDLTVHEEDSHRKIK